MQKRSRGILFVAACIFAVVAWWAYSDHHRKSTAALRAGIMGFKTANYNQAVALLAPWVQANEPDALKTLAEMYARGLGVGKDEVRAGELLRRAECRCAKPGQGEFELAGRILSEISKEDNRHKATYWLVRAAEAGHPDAQAMLTDRAKLSSMDLPIDKQVITYWEARRSH